MSDPLDALLARLEGVRRSGDGYKAKCPGHDDRVAGLSITERDGRILLHCLAGCTFEHLLDVLHMTTAELFSDHHKGNGNRAKRIIAATYDYRDETGKLLFRQMRFGPKDFRPRHPDGAGGWVYDVTGVRRVLYRLPGLLAVDPAQTVFIAEGEKGTDRIRREGLVATCSSFGANDPWLDEHTQALRGRRVVVLPDNDPAGREHAQEVARSLQGVAASVKVLPLPGLADKADIYDWLEDGRTSADLEQLAAKTPEWQAQEPKTDQTEPEPYEPGGEEPETIVFEHVRPRPFTDALRKRYAFFPTGRRGFLYRFDGKIWRNDGEEFEEYRLREDGLLPEGLKKKYCVDEILADVRGLSWEQSAFLPEPSVWLVPFANGVYDLRTKELRPFRPGGLLHVYAALGL